jgi:8-oxo-dGTP diphosphatase
MTTHTLVVAAVCFRDAADRILTVRKRGTTAFMLPGGKLENGEGPTSAALREVHEELGVQMTRDDLTFLGSWTASAANELDTEVNATIYLSGMAVSPIASGEIEELRWVHPADSTDPAFLLAPLLLDFVFPALAA